MKSTIFNKYFKGKSGFAKSVAFFCMVFAASAFADNTSLGTISANIYGTFTDVTKLITATSYIAGLGFAIGSIMKFKAHKDNPTQISIGVPIGLLCVAAALLYLPSILDVAGATIFGTSDGGTTASPTGLVFS